MSDNIFTEEISILYKNRYIKKVTNRAITYADEFKRNFITENNNSKLLRQIFQEHDFNIKILGVNRIGVAGKRLYSLFSRNGLS